MLTDVRAKFITVSRRIQRRARNSVSRSISRGGERSSVTDATRPNPKSLGGERHRLTISSTQGPFLSFTRLAFPSLGTRPSEFHTFRSVHPPQPISQTLLPIFRGSGSETRNFLGVLIESLLGVWIESHFCLQGLNYPGK